MWSSKRTKHIKAKYFLIKDYYDAGEITSNSARLMKCGQMYLTKPLQGQKFRDMWAFLQNCAKNYANSTEAKETIKLQDVASSQKCVDRLPKSPQASTPFIHQSIYSQN